MQSLNGREIIEKIIQNNERLFSIFRSKNSKSSGPLSLKSVLLKQLRQIPGFGTSKAEIIAQNYTTPRALFDAFKNHSTVEDISNLVPQNQEKRIGPTLSSTIHRIFSTTSSG